MIVGLPGDGPAAIRVLNPDGKLRDDLLLTDGSFNGGARVAGGAPAEACFEQADEASQRVAAGERNLFAARRTGIEGQAAQLNERVNADARGFVATVRRLGAKSTIEIYEAEEIGVKGLTS